MGRTVADVQRIFFLFKRQAGNARLELIQQGARFRIEEPPLSGGGSRTPFGDKMRTAGQIIDAMQFANCLLFEQSNRKRRKLGGSGNAA